MIFADPATDTVDWFAVLGVPYTATDREVNSAYRRAVRRFHPDAGGTVAQFRRVDEARNRLADTKQREGVWGIVVAAVLPLADPHQKEAQELRRSRDHWRQSPPSIDPFGPLTVLRAPAQGPTVDSEQPKPHSTPGAAAPQTTRETTRSATEGQRRWFGRLLAGDFVALGIAFAMWWTVPGRSPLTGTSVWVAGLGTLVAAMIIVWAKSEHLTALSPIQSATLIASLGISGAVALAMIVAVIVAVLAVVLALLAIGLSFTIVKALT